MLVRLCGEKADGRFEEGFQENLQAGNFQLIFTHPEVETSEMFLSNYCQRNVVVVVVDEVHCIIESSICSLELSPVGV